MLSLILHCVNINPLSPLSQTHLTLSLFRTRTPSGSGPRGSLQRSGSNLKTPYSADSSRFGSSSALRSAVNSTRDWQQ